MDQDLKFHKAAFNPAKRARQQHLQIWLNSLASR
jgi:hypothetical protein